VALFHQYFSLLFAWFDPFPDKLMLGSLIVQGRDLLKQADLEMTISLDQNFED
jgi:hypothetical protein